MSDERTVKVRIAVVVDHRGYWGSAGDVATPIEELVDEALAMEHTLNLSPVKSISIVTAELPLPEPPREVEGEVEG